MMNLSLEGLILRIPAAFLALVLHEMVKARCSTRLGDPAPRNSGLMQGKPLRYLEPIGFIVTIIFGFGWGRPTPTSPMYYKDIKKGIIFTYLTPSLVNLIAGMVVAMLVGLLTIVSAEALLHSPGTVVLVFHWLFRFMGSFAVVSISVALFNLIPVPPLDAAKLLQVMISPNAAVKLAQNEKVLQIILMFLMILDIIGMVIRPIAAQLASAASVFLI